MNEEYIINGFPKLEINLGKKRNNNCDRKYNNKKIRIIENGLNLLVYFDK